MKKQKVVILIRDGWGYRKSKVKNAIASAKTPFADLIEKKHPTFLIETAGEAVGLPSGFQGNSEVGHITIGSGRVVVQSLVKINNAIKDGSFFSKKALVKAIKNCQQNNSSLHLIGLLQEEGVHAHTSHLFAIIKYCQRENFSRVIIHAVTDGRDSPVNKGREYIKKLLQVTKKAGVGKIVSISGRYYAMDRDNRWERTELAYRAIAEGVAYKKFNDSLTALERSYKKESDEFIIPMTHEQYKGFRKNDSVLFFNFRTDRPRQLTKAITEENFSHFKKKQASVFFVAMTNYYKGLKGDIVFSESIEKNTLGEVVANNKMSQLRISETEKYAHVTFFLNNQREKPFLKEDRIIVPSPSVKTYDKKPEMSAKEVANKTILEIEKEKYDLIVVNLVNADMVGHTNNKERIIKAVECVDKEAEKITKAALRHNYTTLVLADHGNAEDQRKDWATSHTVNPVLLSIISNASFKKTKRSGTLADIAPTALCLLGVEKPEEMLGQTLLSYKK